MNQATRDFIQAHKADNVHTLALHRAPEGVDLRLALMQIEGLQLAAHKLPIWAACADILFPQRLALEQCSSQQTSSYKRLLAEHLIAGASTEKSHFIDLTGGFGVDFAAMAPLFRSAVYVEHQETLCQLARHNFACLGLDNVEVICSEAQQILDNAAAQEHYSLIFIDPARRDAAGHKVALIEDCTPDVCVLQSSLRQLSDWIMIKLSPMLDITAALRALNGIREVHVVSLDGECKELLFLMAGDAQHLTPLSVDDVRICCIDLSNNSSFSFTRADEANSTASYQNAPSLLHSGSYLYEPNASIMKAGAFNTLCNRYPVSKLAPMSHLYVANSLIADFPGRIWCIQDTSTFAKADLRSMLKDVRGAELAVRGFPMSVAQLRRQLHLPDGGEAHLIATTLADGTRLLIRTTLYCPPT